MAGAARAWYAVRASGFISPALVPAPHVVFLKFVELAQDRLALDVWMSTQRVFVGVLLGVLAAVPVGFAIGWYRSVRTFLDPLINFFRALPPIALIPLVIYFGIGETAKIAILFYASFFAGVIVMVEGIGQISPIYVKVARTLGANDAEIFAKVIVPLTVPHILTAVRVALGVAWATLVASELIAAQQGLGALIQNASSFFQLDIIYVGIICIGLIALTMDLALRAATAASSPAGPLRPCRTPRIGFRKRRGRLPRPAGLMGVVDGDLGSARANSLDQRSLGCGKTTLLNMIGAFVNRRGAVLLDAPIPGARPRRDLPGVRRLSLAHGARQHRVRAAPGGGPRRRPAAHRDRRALHDADGPGRLRRSLSEAPLGRHAPAPGAGPRVRGEAGIPADGRALRRARRPDPNGDAGPAAAGAAGEEDVHGDTHRSRKPSTSPRA